MRHLAFIFALACSAANAQTVIYDSFNEDDPADLFDCCKALEIDGGQGMQKQEYRIIFVVPEKGHITEINIPLGYSSGVSNELDVSIQGNHGTKHEFHARNLPPGGQCCSYHTDTAQGVPVVPGAKYEIRVGAHKDTVGTWNLNSLGKKGRFEVYAGDGWQPVRGTLPAIRIIETFN